MSKLAQKRKSPPSSRSNGGARVAQVAVIGGSGFYEMDGIERLRELRVKTPFGAPSDAIMVGVLRGVKVAFLPRHGRGHRILPSEINQRANMWALKSLGCEQVISIAAVGSLKEELPPRTFVFPDQLVDETKGRVSSFFGGGVVAHVSFARPVCGELSELLFGSARRLGLPSQKGGTACVMEGPAFSTKAESECHRRQGYDLIGMTALPEAKLAREAELCYGAVSMVTDYDCWKADEEEVSVQAVVGHLLANAENAKKLVAEAIVSVAERRRACECATALKHAVFTRPDAIAKADYERLELLIGKHVPSNK